MSLLKLEEKSRVHHTQTNKKDPFLFQNQFKKSIFLRSFIKKIVIKFWVFKFFLNVRNKNKCYLVPSTSIDFCPLSTVVYEGKEIGKGVCVDLRFEVCMNCETVNESGR